MKAHLLFFMTLIISGQAAAQVGIGTAAPNTSALLELNASDKGLLLPKVTLTATNASSPMTAHVEGMIVYNTAASGVAPYAVTPGMYYNDGTSWIRMSTKQPHSGDIKYGFQPADHEGWFLINGRVVSTLPLVAQQTAALLGYATNLPDASDRFIKTLSGTETIAATGGAASFTLVRANLPNVNFTGIAASAGVHTHTYTDNPTTAQNYVGGSNNPLANNVDGTFSTGSSGNHTHTIAAISSGGSATPVAFEPQHIVTHVFIYLGN